MSEKVNKRIRNFSIVAHIDHGKSTLADRLLDDTGALSDREKQAQFLDSMELERERGITIKAQTVRLSYTARDGETYQLNLIDTPGHVDFSYEVSRSLQACEGALLVVDAAQGVEAQTLANAYLAVEANLELVPVLNKIDLPAADPERVRGEIEEIIGIEAEGEASVLASAKTGLGTGDVLEAIVQRIPPPEGDREAPLRALVFDSWFDNYRGAIMLIRVFDGTLRRRERIKLWAAGKEFEVDQLGVFAPFARSVDALEAGEVGFVAAAIKDIRDARVGDTVTHAKGGCDEPLPGFQEVQPMVFCGIFPVDPGGFETLRDGLSKLKLNDSSLSFEPESSDALGFGFRCGFLGLLHMEIIQERLERDYGMNLILTAPTVVYEIETTGDETLRIDNPSRLPGTQKIKDFREPFIRTQLYVPEEYTGAVITLCQERRGVQESLEYVGPGRVVVTYQLPLAEVVYDFYDRLKTVTRGYGSMDYELSGYRSSQLVRMDILVNGDPVDALSSIVHRERAQLRGKELVSRLRNIIPRQQFEVALQAAIGTRIICRETVKAVRKNVTARCYGGDITRKRKLLERQKEGKRRMKQVGSVEIPQEAFMTVLQKEN